MLSPINWSKSVTSNQHSLLILKFYWSNFSCYCKATSMTKKLPSVIDGSEAPRKSLFPILDVIYDKFFISSPSGQMNINQSETGDIIIDKIFLRTLLPCSQHKSVKT